MLELESSTDKSAVKMKKRAIHQFVHNETPREQLIRKYEEIFMKASGEVPIHQKTMQLQEKASAWYYASLETNAIEFAWLPKVARCLNRIKADALDVRQFGSIAPTYTTLSTALFRTKRTAPVLPVGE